ncbi:MAG: IMP dehydrogenase [Bdellovibrionota bacterium]|nr:IMP dehydrogenase [Bdellovibrionota bacterium]
MGLRFNWKSISEREDALSFNDVLLVPKKLEMRSRRDPDLKTQFTKKISLDIPLVSSNMDTVTEWEMAKTMNDLGGVGILHRFISVDQQVEQIKRLVEFGVDRISASIGVNPDWEDRARKLVDAGCNVLTIDIAHGHAVSMIEVMEGIKKTFKDVEIVAGNIATPEAARDLINAGADAVKVGIGPGSMCTTRIITGCGVPQLTAIATCAEVTREMGVPLIADGGVKTSGDIVKALAAGADCVMLGSLLSGTIESPGEIRSGKKLYRGMASKSAQENWRGGVPEGMAAEGESHWVAVKGHVSDVINELTGGLRSGMTYINASEIDEIRHKAEFMKMSAAGFSESRAHGLS